MKNKLKMINKIALTILVLGLISSCEKETIEQEPLNANTEKKEVLISKKTMGNIPDFQTTLLTNSTIIGGEEDISFRVFVGEYNQVDVNANTKETKIILQIKKQDGLTLLPYDNTLTSLNNSPVQNNLWKKISDTQNYHRYRYVGVRGTNKFFEGGTAVFIGLEATYTCSSIETTEIKSSLNKKAGGQTNYENDADLDYLECIKVPKEPDFKPTIHASQTNFTSGVSQNFKINVDIENLGGSSDGSLIEVRIPKSSRISFSFDSVTNNEWAYDDSNNSLHKFIYIANDNIFESSTTKSFTISAVASFPENSKGQDNLKATVKYNSGGETNNYNNNSTIYLNWD